MDYIVDFLYQQDWVDIIVSVSCFFITVGIHFYVRKKVTYIAEKEELNSKGPLPDLIHMNVSNLDTGKHTDYIIRYMISGFILIGFILNRIDILLCFLKIYSILKNFRTLCISVTIMPDISGKGKNTWLNGATNDLMFSGHVLVSTLLERFYSTYFVRKEVFWLPFIFNLIIMVNTIITRRHYTIDVLMAWYIAYTFFELSDRFMVLPEKIDFLTEN